MNTLAPRFRTASIVALAVLGVPRLAAATQPLSTFVERAVAQSYASRETSATAQQREAEADAALGRLLPAFSARGVYTRNQYEITFAPPGGGQAITIQRKDQLDGFLQLDVPIVDLAGYHRYQSQKAISRSASDQRAVTSLDVARSVSSAYFSYVGASALARSANLSVKAAADNLRTVEDRVNAGVATTFDRERAVANVERANQDLADAQLSRDLAARNLETLSGLSPTAAAEELSGDDLHDEGPLERWQALALQSPVGKVAQNLREAARQSNKAASTALLPTLSASAQEHFTNASGFSGHSAVYTLQLVAALRLDYTTVASERAQSAAVLAETVREERSLRQVQDDTFAAYRRVQTGLVKSRAARAEAAAAHRAADLASDRYTAGAATQLDVTQAQRDAFLADASRLQADADLAFARTQLRLAVGQGVSGSRSP